MTEQTAAHTPGPWDACDRGDYGDYEGDCVVVLGDNMSRRVAVVFDDDNALLIAAAPALLEGLKSIRFHLVRLGWEENTLMIEGIDDLIAKAEGTHDHRPAHIPGNGPRSRRS